MPELPSDKAKRHPWTAPSRHRASVPSCLSPYAELQVTSNFSFLRGASHPDELAERAAELGLHAIAITDRNTLAGIVRAHVAAKNAGVRLIVGSRLELSIADSDNAESAKGFAEVAEDGMGSESEPEAEELATDEHGWMAGTESDQISRKDAKPQRSDSLDSDSAISAPSAVSSSESASSDHPSPSSAASANPSVTSALSDSPLSVLAYPTDRAAYARLCRLLTRGKRRAPKGECLLTIHDLIEFQEGLLAVVVPPQASPGIAAPITDRFIESLEGLSRVFGDRLSLAVSHLYTSDDEDRTAQLIALSAHTGVALVATNDVHYHVPERRALQDVVTCIRHGTTITRAGSKLFPNGERYLKDGAEMSRLFASMPEAVARGVEIADRVRFDLDELKYQYPDEVCPPGMTPDDYLRELVYRGARKRFTGQSNAEAAEGDAEIAENGEACSDTERAFTAESAENAESASRKSDLCGLASLRDPSSVPPIRVHPCSSVANSSASGSGSEPIPSSAASATPSATSAFSDSALPPNLVTRLEHELALIAELNYATYFLTVYDIVAFARSQDILCQGRGAAANSAVCYCLGVTSVDPERVDMLFERFVSKERDEPPDIDVDFEHERREEVIQHIYAKYGRDRAALTAEVISFRGRSAVREVGKAMGLSLDAVDRLARQLDWWDKGVVKPERVRELGLDPDDPTVRMTLHLTDEILGFPRHLSQHVGGFVITQGLLEEMVPIENAAMEDRTVIEWDKDDIDAMGMLKVDCLGLGMLTCIRKAFEFVNQNRRNAEIAEGVAEAAEGGLGSEAEPENVATDEHGWTRMAGTGSDQISCRDAKPQRSDARDSDSAFSAPSAVRFSGSVSSEHPSPSSATSAKPFATSAFSGSELELHTVPPEDPAVYDMICAADTVGVFQIESRAQMSMLPRLRPRCYYDLVIEVAIVRPGPIQGRMVHPYLRRRCGEEPVSYPSDEVKGVLKRTLGVPLFQEQAMQLAVVAAGFTPGEADQLRRAMATWKRKGDAIGAFEDKFISGMLAHGYDQDFADRCFEQIRGFGLYGFPESHAASFALLVYVSAWLKCHHPAAFAAALINSQPMGFYAPAQIVRDAKEHGVEVRDVDVNFSGWDCRLEERHEGTEARRHEVKRPEMSPRRTLSSQSRNQGAPQILSDSASSASSAVNPLALRLGMRLVRGLAEDDARRIETALKHHGSFNDIESLWRASGAPIKAFKALASADAFQSMGLDRRHALWEVRALRDESLPLFDRTHPPTSCLRASVPPCLSPDLPHMPPDLAVAHDYATVGLSLKAHPMSFFRDDLAAQGVCPAEDLRDPRRCAQNRRVSVAGVVLMRQRPGTASGIVFMTLEDETGIANLIIRPRIYLRFRKVARHAVCLIAHGHVERQGEVVHVIVHRVEDINAKLQAKSRDFH